MKSILLANLAAIASAVSVTGNLSIESGFKPTLISVMSLPANGNEPSTLKRYLKVDKSFEFQLSDGMHLLQVESLEYRFTQVRLQIVGQTIEAFESPLGSDLSKFGNPIPYPLHLTPTSKYNFTKPKSGFSLAGLLANPMILMSVFSMGIMFVLPRMKDMLDDPEMKEALEKKNGNVVKAEVPDVRIKLKLKPKD